MNTQENVQENKQHEELSTTDPLYDLSMLEEMEDDEYLIEVVSLFLQETPAELKEMKSAVSSGNSDVVYKKAHKLKSSSGVILANKLTEVLDGIEIIAKAKTINAELASLVENAIHQFNNIELALKKHMKLIA